jgi:hypothetical protein
MNNKHSLRTFEETTSETQNLEDGMTSSEQLVKVSSESMENATF